MDVLAVACLFASAPPLAAAAEYRGALSYSRGLVLTIDAGQVIAFHAGSVAVPCEGLGPSLPRGYLLAPGMSVPVVGGAFRIEGDAVDDYEQIFHWTLAAAVSADGRKVTGKLIAQGRTFWNEPCLGTYDIEAILAPRPVKDPLRRSFEPLRPTALIDPLVRFNFKHGAISELTAGVQTTCPNGSRIRAKIDTADYGLDPIRVSNDGAFRIESDVLDDHGVPVHFVLSGRIKERIASGRIEAYRGQDGGTSMGSSLKGATGACGGVRAPAGSPGAACRPPTLT
jgi:hypothetical protein